MSSSCASRSCFVRLAFSLDKVGAACIAEEREGRRTRLDQGESQQMYRSKADLSAAYRMRSLLRCMISLFCVTCLRLKASSVSSKACPPGPAWATIPLILRVESAILCRSGGEDGVDELLSILKSILPLPSSDATASPPIRKSKQRRKREKRP